MNARFLGLVATAALFYGALQISTPRIVGVDGHFHIRLAAEMWARGVVYSLPELGYTSHEVAFRDHHFGFHLLYMVFALMSDLYAAAKCAAWVSALIAASFYLCILRLIRVRRLWFWLVIYLGGSIGFTYRMLMPRVSSLSLAFLLFGLFCIVKKRTNALAVAAFMYVWSYDAWPLLGCVVLLFVCLQWSTEPRSSRELMVAWCVGTVAGVLVNPYFPTNLFSYVEIIVGQFAPRDGVGMGLEMRPYDTWSYVTGQLPIVVMAAVGCVLGVCCLSEKAADDEAGARQFRVGVTIVALCFVGLSLKSRRYVEYAVPFTCIALAVLTDEKLEVWTRGGRAVLSGLLVSLCVMNAGRVASLISVDERYECARKAGQWAATHIAAGETFFTGDWDNIPELYINAPRLKYVGGLDPIYMWRRDENKYKVWKEITGARWEGLVSEGIRSEFGARFVYVDRGQLRLAHRLEVEPGVRRSFSGEGCWIFSY